MKCSIFKSVSNITEWEALFPRQEQWKDGRSAKELANYFVVENNGALPLEIEHLVKSTGVIADVEWHGEPEHRSYLDGAKGNTRNHDLFLYNNENSIVIGIEAKADESLGNYVDVERKASEALVHANQASKKKERLETLSKHVYGGPNFNEATIRYQLLTATVGILNEAVEADSHCPAMLLVLTFVDKTKTKPANLLRNKTDIHAFITSLNMPKISDDLYGPVLLPGFGGNEFFIGTIERNI